jgi:hypothetical protein
LTPELQARIASFVRAGCFPHVAAEAAGLSCRIFQNWLRRGSHARAKQPYRGFAEEVRQATAQARLRAEIAIIDKRPLDWLKCGPGKETSRRPGWSTAPKAQTAARVHDNNLLADPRFRGLGAKLLAALTPFPDARLAVADQVPELRQSRRRRPPRAGS